MRAVILRHTTHPGVSMVDIAGQPLIARQLEWLRDEGVDEIALELEPHDKRLVAWLTARPALADNVRIIPATDLSCALRAATLARFPLGAPFIAIPGGMLSSIDLSRRVAAFDGHELAIYLEGVAGLPAGRLLISSTLPAPRRRVYERDWGCLLSTQADGLALGAMAARSKIDGVLIHGAEARPSIWTARGAVIEPGAVVHEGVVLGRGSLVCSGATVGPDVVIGDGAVIEADARLSRCIVDANVIVGGGVVARDVVIRSRGFHDLVDERRVLSVDDPLMLAARRSKLWRAA